MFRRVQDWLPIVVVVAIVTGAVVWQNQREEEAPPERQARCQRLSGSLEGRVRACLMDLQRSVLSAPAKEVVSDIAGDGKLLALADFDVKGASWVGFGSDPALQPLLLGLDEPAVARKLRSDGVRGVVVSRDLVGAVDRDTTVLARLAHHDHLDWFQLRYVTDDLLIYTVRSSPSRVPLATGDQLLKGLRARLEGRQAVARQVWNPSAVRLIGVVRGQGASLVDRHVVLGQDTGGAVLERALDELAEKIAREWERTVEVDGKGQMRDQLDRLRLEIHVVMERAPVEPRSQTALFELWEMGVDGMMFRQRPPEGDEQLDEKFTYMAGSELVTRSLHSPDEFLRVAVRDGGWRDDRPWEKDRRTRLDLVRTQHFAESEIGGGPAVRLVRGMPEVAADHVTEPNVEDMLVAGGEWWLANQRLDGSFEYKFWPEQNRSSEDYNEVRHILGARDLVDTWRYRNDPRYFEGARRAMDWLMRYAVDAGDPPAAPLPHPPAGTLLFRYPSYAEEAATKKKANQKLGTVAVALLGWVAWADATGSHAEDERIRKMAEFVRAMQEPDGRFKPYFVHAGHAYEESRNDIVPGEAMLALGQVAEYFGEPAWIEAWPRFVGYYRPWFLERAERKVPAGRWPRDTYTDQDRLDLVQFGPWSVMAAAQVYRLTKDASAGTFGLEVADWMIDNYQWRSDRSPWPDYVGGYYKMPSELPAMQTFCYSEGTAAAYALATMVAPERKDRYDQSTREAIRFLEVMQFDDLDSYFVSRPDKVRGGIKYTMNENKIRIDYVGHGLSTLSQWLDARRADPSAQVHLYDPTDLARLAGTRHSVPGLDYSGVPAPDFSGEVATGEAAPDVEIGDAGARPRPAPAPRSDADDEE
jgi:hypothetical protein